MKHAHRAEKAEARVAELEALRKAAPPEACRDGYLCEHGYCSHTQPQRTETALRDVVREFIEAHDADSLDGRELDVIEKLRAMVTGSTSKP